ncbi:MAG: hypothetical protein AUK47_03935 [Deltaproteobacteria bacterium CG2_30_63_29]|nr:MAG: hypothetical protein AUK47_03935 [Deltaproteobacteria bacterium CG2_30_63_29]PIV99623.1 MAG: hypothetical protein COW42_10430 [Deltaproteobacteria bacterium CG17_big_fil_post_rev_8_21_14_2_50_63_7]PJB39867.1 MAG: hypothetical protein CO108_16340 [Deltaproteobacteria bacterium CG_4_9_14_3_um_filter_63_12]
MVGSWAKGFSHEVSGNQEGRASRAGCVSIQGDMKRRIAYVLAGRFVAVARDPPEPALAAVAAGWRLLLQVDDDNILYTAWGGRLVFWIGDEERI